MIFLRKYFYHFVLKFRGDNLYGDFAEEVYRDLAFPKHSTDYNEISSYLELNGGDMNTFDNIWNIYEIEELL